MSDTTPTLLPPVSAARARAIANRFASAHVLVLGDAMLDKFIVGRVTRISPEAPVPVVAYEHEMVRIGGAANVANNIAALGGQTTLVAVTGQDEGAATLAHACQASGIGQALVGDGRRPTTTKMRIVTDRNQQVARVDFERDEEIAGDVEARIIAAVRQHAARSAVIVVSDYMKGCITRAVMQAVVAAAGERVPILVDPKVPHVDYYANATLVTPNHHEAETTTHVRVRSHEDARQAARAFRTRAQCRGVLMTRGDQGMWLMADDGAEGYLPAVAREVADVTGAGDTVIATVALALAAGASIQEAVGLANEAAGIVVGRFGAAVVKAEELLDALKDT